MERDKSLRIMNVVGAVLFGLTALLYVLIIIFPRGVLNAFLATADIEIDTTVIVFMLIRVIKPVIFAVIGIIGFRRKNMSFGWGIGTAVSTGILWIFPSAGLQLYFASILSRIVSAQQFAIENALDSAMNALGFITSVGILLIFGSAVAEAYAVKKLQNN
ncbi:MAG: hypothetical protein NC340_01585 [Ruminococcus flavefaciens]|nr:hypothetical protein [Ruminococcus flavefaciens]MCM1228839.1 hypothetical protein [Ruminococcus flavefaciens]